MRYKITFDILPQYSAERHLECAFVDGLLNTGVQGTGIQADIVITAFGGHHVGRQVAFIHPAFHSQGHHPETGLRLCVAKDAAKEED